MLSYLGREILPLPRNRPHSIRLRHDHSGRGIFLSISLKHPLRLAPLVLIYASEQRAALHPEALESLAGKAPVDSIFPTSGGGAAVLSRFGGRAAAQWLGFSRNAKIAPAKLELECLCERCIWQGRHPNEHQFRHSPRDEEPAYVAAFVEMVKGVSPNNCSWHVATCVGDMQTPISGTRDARKQTLGGPQCCLDGSTLVH